MDQRAEELNGERGTAKNNTRGAAEGGNDRNDGGEEHDRIKTDESLLLVKVGEELERIPSWFSKRKKRLKTTINLGKCVDIIMTYILLRR